MMNWRNREWKYIPAAAHADSAAFRRRQQERRRAAQVAAAEVKAKVQPIKKKVSA
jgi:hypothetical protein